MTTSTIDIRLIPSTQYVTPTTGSTVNANNHGNLTLLIDPAGTLLALTVALNGSPTDGDEITIGSSQIVTGLTISGGTVISTLTSLAVGSFAKFKYNATATKWFRIG